MRFPLPLLLILALLIPIALLACGNADADEESAPAAMAPAATMAAAEAPAAEAPFSEASFTDEAPAFAEEASFADAAPEAAAPSGEGDTGESTQTAGRMVIHTGHLTVVVEDVPATVAQIRTITESSGGFIEQLSHRSDSDDDSHSATITMRVPHTQFFSVMDRIGQLGEVLRADVTSDDVTEQFIDLEARLRSLTREEARLLAFLDRTETVADLLEVERELSRVRTAIERAQGQINAISSRVDLSTITVTLRQPEREVIPEPPVIEAPSGDLEIAVPDVQRAIDATTALVERFEGVLLGTNFSASGDAAAARMAIRVFTPDFAAVLAGIEQTGDVQSKEISDPGDPPPDAVPAEVPDARIAMHFIQVDPEVEDVGGVNPWSIIGPILGILLAGAAGFWYRRSQR